MERDSAAGPKFAAALTSPPSSGAPSGFLAAAVVIALFAAGAAQANVLSMGGSRDPGTGIWTGLASLETVPVADLGNPASSSGYGKVDYLYNVGKYDVTAAQYTEFLNAVAATTDPYELYNTNMASSSGACQIQRTVVPGGFSYSVSSTYANRPVNYVSFGDAARFANWLQNGQQPGAEDLATTEDGAYFLNGAINNTQYGLVTRKASWQWAVTSEDEWYKAAYYNGATGVYNLYATGGNSITTAMANYADSQPTDVGAYPYASPYGTFDQSGNVWGWLDPVSAGGFPFYIRGGEYADSSAYVVATFRGISGPAAETSLAGFRVSLVPEPTAVSLLALAGLGALLRRRSARGR